MQIVVLAAIMVALTLAQPSPGQALVSLHEPSAVTPLALAGYLLAAVVLRRLATGSALRAFVRQDEGLGRSVGRAKMLSLAADAWLVFGQALPLLLGYARWVSEALHLGGWPMVGNLPVLAPYLGAQVGAWVMQYPFWQAARLRSVGPDRPTWTRGQYLAYSLRHNVFFVMAPLAMLFVAGDLLGLARRADWISETTQLMAMPVVWLVVFAWSPVLIMRLWRTRPLPPGPLRTRLEASCGHLRLRYRDIRLWQTGGVLANAGVIGLVGPLRYVLVTDALLADLPPEQVEAVFAHEAGHIVFRHIPYSLLFGLCATTAAGGLSLLAAWVLGDDSPLTDVTALAALAGLFFLGFGFISRRFERQSDVFAAWAVGSARPGEADEFGVTNQGAALFAAALERVGELNGTPPHQYNWRHGSIAGRVGYIMWLGSTGGSRRPIDRTVRGIKVALWVACGLGVAAAVAAWIFWPAFCWE